MVFQGFLSRKPRWGFGVEEFLDGDLERECIEETCNVSEFLSIFFGCKTITQKGNREERQLRNETIAGAY